MSQVVFMFSGQGSQHYHMGRELYDSYPAFRRHLLYVEEMIQDRFGYSVLESVFDASRKKMDPFDRTQITHPAIFMIEYSLASALMEEGIRPSYLLGASLGAFAAAAVARCLTLEQALMVIIEQARIVERYGEQGGMMAVLGNVDKCVARGMLFDCEIAAVSSPGHFVLSATENNLSSIEERFRNADIACQRLAVKRPFHSRWIEAARKPFHMAMRDVTFSPPQIPLICCSEPMVPPTLSVDILWNILRQPIQFEKAIKWVRKRGDFVYIDVGPSSTMAGLANYATGEPPLRTLPVLTPFGRDMKHLTSLRAALGVRPQ